MWACKSPAFKEELEPEQAVTLINLLVQLLAKELQRMQQEEIATPEHLTGCLALEKKLGVLEAEQLAFK